MKICLDFDGVLHDAAHPVAGRRMGPPLAGALGAVLLLTDAGHQLIVHTARVEVIDEADHVIEWLRYYGFPGTMAIYTQKPFADVYLDDKGLHFNDWASALSDIEEVARNGFGTYTLRARPTGSGRDGAERRPHRRDRQRGARLPRTGFGGEGDG